MHCPECQRDILCEIANHIKGDTLFKHRECLKCLTHFVVVKKIDVIDTTGKEATSDRTDASPREGGQGA